MERVMERRSRRERRESGSREGVRGWRSGKGRGGGAGGVGMAEGGVVPVMRIHGMYYHLPSTLTRVEEPYPMLVLCGPPGSGKGYLTKLLVEEFPSFFGLG